MYILTYSFVTLFSKIYKVIFRGILSILDVGLCVSKRVIEQFIKVREVERREEILVSIYLQKESSKNDVSQMTRGNPYLHLVVNASHYFLYANIDKSQNVYLKEIRSNH